MRWFKEAWKRRVIWGVSFCALILTAGCWEEETKAPAAAAPKVIVAKATADTVPLFLELSGRTEAPNTVSIRSRVDGHVESRHFEEGLSVRRGDRLFVIDQRPYSTALAQLLGERNKNQANLEFAAKELDRVTVLVDDGAISTERLEEMTAKMAEAQGNFDSSQGAVDTAQVNLDYTTVSAPIDGRIGRVFQDVGNVVSANDTVLVDVVQMDPLYVYVSPSEEQFLDLKKYQGTDADLKVEITLVDGTTHPHAGALDFFSPGVDPATGTIAVRTVFPNPEWGLRPGQYTQVRIQLTEQKGQITVPAEAVGQDQAGFFVFVVDDKDAAKLRRVKVGRIYDGRRIVDSGLKEGETVIVQGQQRVRTGMTVEIKKPATGNEADG